MSGCRGCGGSELAPVLALGDLPLADAFLRPDQLAQEEPLFPLEVGICPSCALVQLVHDVPRALLFPADFPYHSSVSESWVAHAARHVAAVCERRSLGADSLVVEVGSNDGYLLQHYVARGVPVLGIDPADGVASVARARGIATRTAFFDHALACALRAEGIVADVVHANNVLAHVPDPADFLAGVRLLLRAGGEAHVEVPYVRDLVERGAFDTIYHEHHCYFSVTALAALCQRAGLSIRDVEPLPTHGGSLRATLVAEPATGARVAHFLAREARDGVTDPAWYASFGARVAALLAALRESLERERRRGARIAAYGAAAKGTTLLNAAGLDAGWIEFVVDRSPHKQGRFVPGVRLPILAPEALAVRRADLVLLLAWNLADEILAQQAAFRARGGRFLVPVPAPRIVA